MIGTQLTPYKREKNSAPRKTSDEKKRFVALSVNFHFCSTGLRSPPDPRIASWLFVTFFCRLSDDKSGVTDVNPPL